MKYRCMIVDDEELARTLIQNHLSQLDDFEVVASCESAIEASKILSHEKIDLLFLDIEMPVLKGTDFLRNLIQKPKVIFTTAYRDYALDGFELNAVDYLLKPITFGRFFKAVEKFREHKSKHIGHTNSAVSKTADHIFVRKDRKQVRVLLDQILYIEGAKDYVQINTLTDQHLIKNSITGILTLLDDRFVRIHRSFIINRDKVTAYTKQDVEIATKEIPIGDSYKSALEKLLR